MSALPTQVSAALDSEIQRRGEMRIEMKMERGDDLIEASDTEGYDSENDTGARSSNKDPESHVRIDDIIKTLRSSVSQFRNIERKLKRQGTDATTSNSALEQFALQQTHGVKSIQSPTPDQFAAKQTIIVGGKKVECASLKECISALQKHQSSNAKNAHTTHQPTTRDVERRYG